MTAVSQLTVQPDEADMRFDRWCKKHFPSLAFGQMQRLLRTGQFRLDGKRLDAGDRLATGQTVRVPPMPEPGPEGAEPRPRAGLRDGDRELVRGLVLHEDEKVIVLNKPAGLAVQGGSGTTRHVDGMLEALQARGADRPRLVHRLDRDTSGLLVVAKDAPTARELAFAFQQHKVRKLYWAVLLRGPERNEGRIDLPLGKAGPPGREKVEIDPEAGGQFARTYFRVLARAGKVAAWAALLPTTGRTHQLRAHCAAMDAPIVGDGKYGGKAAHPEGAPKGLMLHARELELPVPGRKRPLRVAAEPPRAFREALAWVGLAAPELPGAGLDDWPPEEAERPPAAAREPAERAAAGERAASRERAPPGRQRAGRRGAARP